VSDGIILNVIVPRRTMGNPFGTLDLMWCHHCQTEVDSDNDVGNRMGRYVFRARCLRCGGVLSWGAYEVPHVGDKTRMMAMKTWCAEPGRDRR
jgi:hypothetical protein